MPNKREQNPVKLMSKDKVPKSFMRDHKIFEKAYARDSVTAFREKNPRPKVSDVGF